MVALRAGVSPPAVKMPMRFIHFPGLAQQGRSIFEDGRKRRALSVPRRSAVRHTGGRFRLDLRVSGTGVSPVQNRARRLFHSKKPAVIDHPTPQLRPATTRTDVQPKSWAANARKCSTARYAGWAL